MKQQTIFVSLKYKDMKELERLEVKDLLEYHGKTDIYKEHIACFALNKNSRMANIVPCYANAMSFILVTSGHTDIAVNNMHMKVNPQSLIILSPAHLTHLHNLSDDFDCIHLMISKSFFEKIPQIQRYITYIVHIMYQKNRCLQLDVDSYNVLKRCMDIIKDRIDIKNHLFHNEIINNTLQAFMLEFINIWKQSKEQELSVETNTNRQEELLFQFVDLLSFNYKTEHCISFYAENLNVTPQYLSRIVKLLMRETINKIIYNMLYNEAEALLRRGEHSIQQIADELNFSDQSAFGKFFKKHSGKSPLEFKRMILQAQNQ